MKHQIVKWIVIALVTSCTTLDNFVPDTPPTEAPELTSDDWRPITTGLDQRTYVPNGNGLAQLITLRINPQYASFQVKYRPDAPLTLQGWRTELPDADIIINANFFTPEHQALGLLVSDGQQFGRSYTDRGGTFGILDGAPVVRSNIYQPYQGEAYQQAIQAFPMLILNGEAAYSNARDTSPSRRTVIGQDASGNILLMATPALGLSLPDLSSFLAATDIDLQMAFNLDGGGSTMMYVADSEVFLPSFDAVPAVLAVYLQDG